MRDTRFSGNNFRAVAAGIRPPVQRGLMGFGFPGVDALNTGRNMLLGSNAVPIIGAPSFADGSARFQTHAAFLDTLFGETSNATLLVVARHINGVGTIKYALGNVGNAFDGDTVTTGLGLRYHRTTGIGLTYGQLVGGNPSFGVIDLGVTDPLAWIMASGRIAGGSSRRIANLGAGTANEQTTTIERAINTATTVRVGSSTSFDTNPLPAAGGNIDVAFWAYHNVTLTIAEELAWRDFVRARLTALADPIVF